MKTKLILVSGATGYIAGQLIPRLLERGYRVRCLARHVERLAGRPWAAQVEIVPGDITRPETLPPALQDIHTAYYLIHNMASGRGYTRLETEGAHNFAAAAERAGVQHIIYLGGLADPNAKIAPHMRSRIRTGQTLRRGKVPVTEFRAGVIVGPGSISFEMIRFLTEFFPILLGPRWLNNRVQPIATRNVIDYLAAALERPDCRGGIYEIGGPDVMPYAEAMFAYARLRGLRRSLVTLAGIPVPFMAWWVDRLTPVPFLIARALIAGLSSDSIVLNDATLRVFTDIQLADYDQSVAESLNRLSPMHLNRIWEGTNRPVTSAKHEGFFIDCRRAQVNAPPELVYRVFNGMGGVNGWLYANWFWRLRGWLDRLFGGPGLRGRPPRDLRVGDAVDYYRVEALKAGRLMRLYSELKAPGEGWMEWRVEAAPGRGRHPEPLAGSVLTQTAFFAPRGLPGFLYWSLLSPLHRLVFRGLVETIIMRSERAS